MFWKNMSKFCRRIIVLTKNIRLIYHFLKKGSKDWFNSISLNETDGNFPIDLHLKNQDIKI
jgi:hypothetical protein